MKKIIVLLSLLVFVACKRKLTEVTPEGTLVKYAAHCYNGVYDSTEVGVDCGGNCESCLMATPDCTQSPNVATFNLTNYTITNVTNGSTSNLSQYIIKGLVGGGTIEVELYGTVPNMSKSYVITSGGGESTGLAGVTLNLPSYGSMNASEGRVYVSMLNGKFFVIVCNATFGSSVTFGSYKGNRIGILCN